MTNPQAMTNLQAMNRIGDTLDFADVMKITGTICTYKVLMHKNSSGTYSAIIANVTYDHTTQVGDSSKIGLARKIIRTFANNEEVLDTKIGD